MKNHHGDEQKFVLINSEDFSTHNFVARIDGDETIRIGDKSYDAVKIVVTLDNWLLSKIWSNRYWFRKEDGLFLKEVGNDGPGTLNRIRELSHE